MFAFDQAVGFGIVLDLFFLVVPIDSFAGAIGDVAEVPALRQFMGVFHVASGDFASFD